MATAQVKWDKNTTFLGRNGYFHCSGVDLTTDESKLYVAPLTGRGDVGRCTIEVPLEKLDELIASLQAMRTGVKKV
jgi:hypothetical protein